MGLYGSDTRCCMEMYSVGSLSSIMNNLDQKIQDLAKLAQGVNTAKTDNKSWIWQVIVGALFAISLWYLRFQLAQKEKELAAVKTELEGKRIDAQIALTQTKIDDANANAKKLQDEAQQKVMKAFASEAKIKEEIVAHEERKKKLAQIENFEDLNKIAGIP